jgi:hypothetical protein
MTDEQKPAEVKPADVKPAKWVKSSQGVFETYSNQTHLTWSLDDVKLRFAQLGEANESAGPGDALVTVNVHKATITVSWRNAKILHAQLGLIVGNYEKVNGEINLKPTLASNEGT